MNSEYFGICYSHGSILQQITYDIQVYLIRSLLDLKARSIQGNSLYSTENIMAKLFHFLQK